MKKILIFLSFLYVCFEQQFLTPFRQKIIIFTPEIREQYSIATQMNQQQNMKNRKNNPVQQINIRPPPLPQPETKSQPKPEPKPQAPINSPENIKPVIKDSLVPQTKEIKVQTKNAMPKNDIQFKDNNAQIKIKVDKTFNVYNIDERSIIDGSGNVVSFDKVITNTVNNDIRQNKVTTKFEVKGDTDKTTTMTQKQIQKSQTQQEEETQNEKRIRRQKQVEGQVKKLQQRWKNVKKQVQKLEQRFIKGNQEKQPQNGQNQREIIIEQQKQYKIIDENQTNYKTFFMVLFGIASLLIIFGYTPQNKLGHTAVSTGDQEQNNLR